MELNLKAVLKENVRKLKDERGWAEADVAKAGSIGTGTVNRILNQQNVQLVVLGGVAKAFGIPAWALLIPNVTENQRRWLYAVANDTLEAKLETEVKRRVQRRWSAIQGQIKDLRVPDDETDRPTVGMPFVDREASSGKRVAPLPAGKSRAKQR